jgi:hypothetical protein
MTHGAARIEFPLTVCCFRSEPVHAGGAPDYAGHDADYGVRFDDRSPRLQTVLRIAGSIACHAGALLIYRKKSSLDIWRVFAASTVACASTLVR